MKNSNYKLIIMDEQFCEKIEKEIDIDRFLSYLFVRYELYLVTTKNKTDIKKQEIYKIIHRYLTDIISQKRFESKNDPKYYGAMLYQIKHSNPDDVLYMDDSQEHLFAASRAYIGTCFYNNSTNDCLDFYPEIEVQSENQVQKVL